jgi:bleomycin hydrolase
MYNQMLNIGDYESSAEWKLAENALSSASLKRVSLSRKRQRELLPALGRHESDFSVRVSTSWPLAMRDQKSSGRCWLFAGLLLIADDVQSSLECSTAIELSASYLYFFDKFERANFILQCAVDHSHCHSRSNVSLDNERMRSLLAQSGSDGGQFQMFANLVAKYGVVPADCYPETRYSSESSGELARSMRHFIAEGFAEIRREADALASLHRLDAIKRRWLAVVYRVLCVHLGTPPTRFDFRFERKTKKKKIDYDKKKETESVHLKSVSAVEFARRHVSTPLGDYVSLINDPRRPYGRHYELAQQRNVIEAPPTRYANVSSATMKAAARRMLEADRLVWVGIEFGAMTDRDLGLLDVELFDVEPLYGARHSLSKADRLRYRIAGPNHAVVLSAVDIDRESDAPTRWLVENSHGKRSGHRGRYIATDAFFDEHIYEVVIDRRFVEPVTLDIFNRPSQLIYPWDSIACKL